MTIALSWSRWSDYDQCPRKFSLKYVAKAENFKEDPGQKSMHLVRGENIHKQLENYVLWKHELLTNPEAVKPGLSPEAEAAVPLIERLWASSDTVLPESQIAVDKEWKRVEWFAKNAYYRAILDLVAIRQDHGIIWDWKTGKYQAYTSECGQLHLSAAIGIVLKGWSYVDVAYIFLDHKKPASIRVTQEDAPRIIKIFDERHEMVNSDVTWAPKKNDNCGWCEATKAQCPHSKKAMAL